MADLDDFFAKKDRKKSKGKKFLTADELVKNLEDTSKREPPKPKKEPAPAVVAAAPPTPEGSSVANDTNDNVAEELPALHPPKGTNNEEEWKEIEVEERKDYSGLKIGQLTIHDDEENQQNYGDVEGYDEDEGEGNDGTQMSELKMRGYGPWKKVVPAEEVTQIPMEIEKTVSNKVYVTPALRNSQNISALRMNKLRKGTAPDITNEDYFPTLGAARPEEQKKKKNEPAFEEVRHGGRLQRVQEPTLAPVSVANRFKSLEDDDS